jgi:hypothetical protein
MIFALMVLMACEGILGFSTGKLTKTFIAASPEL